MKKFRRTKSGTQLLRELKEGESITIPHQQMRIVSVRRAVLLLKKEGYNLIATEKGQINSIKVTKVSNPTQSNNIQ